jgi:hypothetical protein
MLKLNLVLIFLFINISVFADERVAPVTCAVISETTLDQSAYRVKEVNEARSKLNLEPYLEGDDEILLSIKLKLCSLLIMDYEEYKNKSEILVLAEKEEIERRRKAREKAQEELRRKLEATQRKENEERERKSLQERLDAKNKIINEINEHRKQLETSFDICDLPNDSTKISISKDKLDLSLRVVLDFTESVKKSCPSLISESRGLAKRLAGPQLTEGTQNKLLSMPITRFYFIAKIDGFDSDLILNTSYSNFKPIFNIDFTKRKKTLFSGTKSIEQSVGIDSSNKNDEFPYSSDYRPNNRIKPFFTNTNDLKKVNVGMIREVSLVSEFEIQRTYFNEWVLADYKPFKKVLYSRGE